VIGTCYADYWDGLDDPANNADKSWYQAAKKFEVGGWIDETSNLNQQPVYVLSGLKDTIVPPVKQ